MKNFYDDDEDEFQDDFEDTDDEDTDDDDDDDIKSNSIILDDDFDDDEDEEEQENIKPVKSITTPVKATKLLGKHSLAYDTIFKGKKNKLQEEDYEQEHIIKNAGGSLDIFEENLDNEESKSSQDYYREVRLKTEIKRCLQLFTDINFAAKRRIPAKSDFNAYYIMLIKELHQFGYSKCEIFIELAGYFSDNYWNVFKLLDRKYTNIIIAELKEKYGLSDVDKLDIF